MAFGPHFTMPGVFHMDGPSINESPPSLVGMPHHGLFHPPAGSPSNSSSMHLSKSSMSLPSESATPSVMTAKRKRGVDMRADAIQRDWAFPSSSPVPVQTYHNEILQLNTRMPDIKNHGNASQSKHYMLAGQLDIPSGGDIISPGVQNRTECLEDSNYSDSDYRRELGAKRHCDSILDADCPGRTPPLSQVPNELPPSTTLLDGQTVANRGWNFALHAVGTVVGKVWEFCKSSAFRGFYAGGGTGYDASGNISSQPPEADSDLHLNQHANLYHNIDSGLGGIDLPLSDCNSDTLQREQSTTPDHARPPAPKRRQVSENQGDELQRNWVLVTEPKNSKPLLESSTSPFSNHRRATKKCMSNRSSISSYSHSVAFQTPSRATTSQQSLASPLQNRFSAPTSTSTRRRISVPASRLSYQSNPSLASNAFAKQNKYSSRTRTADGLFARTFREPASFASARSPAHSLSHPGNHSSMLSPASYQRPNTPSRIPVPTCTNANPFALKDGTSRNHITIQGHRKTGSTASVASISPPPLSSYLQSPRSSQSSRRLGATEVESGGSRRKSGAHPLKNHSPRLTDEAKALAHRRLVQEREVDQRMNRFNKSLQDMIRMGKEALGTQVEVMGDNLDSDGFEDELEGDEMETDVNEFASYATGLGAQ